MIIVVADAVVKEGMKGQFIAAAQKCVAKTRLEEGNLSYDLKNDCFQDNKFTFFEQWKTKEALDGHMETKHFKEFGAGIQNILAEELSICVYEAEKQG